MSKLAGNVDRDEEGFLCVPSEWTPEIARTIAGEMHLNLTDEHLRVLYVARQFHAEYGVSPVKRALLRMLHAELGAQAATSAYLIKLFPGMPARTVALLAGLPKPPNCL